MKKILILLICIITFRLYSIDFENIVEMCRERNINDLKKIINVSNANMKNESGRTLLYEACNNGWTDVVELLMEKKADVNLYDSPEYSPIYAACRYSYRKIAEILIRNQVKVNFVFNNNENLLHCVSDPFIAEMIIKKGVDINKRNNDGETPLILSAERGLPDTVEILLKYGADINALDNKGNSALIKASQCYSDKGKYAETIKVIFKYNPNYEIFNDKKENALLVFLTGGYERSSEKRALLDELLKNLSDEHINKNSFMILNSLMNVYLGFLSDASSRNMMESEKTMLLKDFISKKINLNAIDNSKRPVLELACSNGKYDFVRILLENKADPDIKNEYMETPLFGACRNGQIEIVKLLISNKADINLKDKNGNTPLYIAAAYNRKDIYDYLVKNNAQNDVFSAARIGDVKALESFFKSGISPDIKDNYGEPLVFQAVNGNSEDSLMMLIKYNANINCKNRYSDTPLIVASGKGMNGITEILVKNRADLDIQSYEGDTALIAAVKKNHAGCVEILLKYKAVKTIANRDKMTAEEYAVSKGNYKIQALLNYHDLAVYYYPAISNLKFRENPGINGKTIRFFETDEKLNALEYSSYETIDNITARWVKVRTAKGETGWCFEGYLKKAE